MSGSYDTTKNSGTVLGSQMGVGIDGEVLQYKRLELQFKFQRKQLDRNKGKKSYLGEGLGARCGRVLVILLVLPGSMLLLNMYEVPRHLVPVR